MQNPGGQIQQLGIARALYKEPEILVLDEATSAFDNISEQKFLKAIYANLANKTIISIAHRTSSILQSDKVIYMNEGKIIDHGTIEYLENTYASFKELMSR